MSKRLLIVDDSPEILDMLKLTFKVWCPECHVVLATNGLEALTQMKLQERVQPFDIVLTDYDMPLMNGIDLAQEIRQLWPNTHIVLMSGDYFDKKHIHADAYPVKFDGFIEKPFVMRQVKRLFLTDPGILQ
jgi:two-component system response regulator YesN